MRRRAETLWRSAGGRKGKRSEKALRLSVFYSFGMMISRRNQPSRTPVFRCPPYFSTVYLTLLTMAMRIPGDPRLST